MKFNKLLFLGVVIILLISLFAFYNNRHTLERIIEGVDPPKYCKKRWIDPSDGTKYECYQHDYLPTNGKCPSGLTKKKGLCRT